MAAGDAGLLSLDTAILTRVLQSLSPLPDRFACAASCRRLRAAAQDPRLATVLAPGADLAAVIARSRPGDTIHLAAGAARGLGEAGLVLHHPLRLVGAPGCGAPETALSCGARGVPAVRVEANACLERLSISSWLAPSVEHVRGVLKLDGCSLEVGAHPLAELTAPLVASAAARVSATSLSGANGVNCRRGSSLIAVRAAYGASGRLLWFDVVSGSGGSGANGGGGDLAGSRRPCDTAARPASKRVRLSPPKPPTPVLPPHL